MNTTRRRASLFALIWALAAPADAQDLSLPSGAEMTRETISAAGAYDLPVGPWSEEAGLPVRRVEGRIVLQAFRLEGSGLTPFQLIAPLRRQLQEDGYEIVLDCTAQACGGFDFRFATLVLPAPEMFVDLTAFHAVSALRGGAGVFLLASRDTTGAYLQIVRAGAGRAVTATDAPAPVPAATGDLTKALEARGHAVLDDLEFASGSVNLGEGPIASLDAIAAYLQERPSRRILFVGHTDATGSLEANRALSRRRAQAAVSYLRERHGVPPDQIGADGVGYLAPIATNLTEEGREANRRVEAVLISTE